MNPTAISQLAEQSFRVVVGLALAYYLIPSGYERSTPVRPSAVRRCSRGLAVVVIIYLLNLPAIQTRIRRNRSKAQIESTKSIIKRILIIAIPITIGRRSCR